MKKVLATAWHPGSANAIAPVIERLNREGNVAVVPVGHEFSEAVFKNRGISYGTIQDYKVKDVSSQSLDEILRVESPDLVLTGTSIQDDKHPRIIEQESTLAAKKLHNKSLAVLDYWANYWQRFSDVYGKERFGYLPDKIAIMDGFARDDMLGEGFKESKLVITGNPHFDSLEEKARKFNESDKKKVRKAIEFDPAFLVFYAGSAFKSTKGQLGYWDGDNVKIMKNVLDELPEVYRNKVGIAVKLHPRMPEDDLKEIRGYIGEDSRMKLLGGLPVDIGAQEIILSSDLTVTPNSTVGIEAVYMGKHCMSMQPRLIGKDQLIVSRRGIIPVGYGDLACKSTLTAAMMYDDYRTNMINMAKGFRTDGKATERVSNLVYEMLG